MYSESSWSSNRRKKSRFRWRIFRLFSLSLRRSRCPVVDLYVTQNFSKDDDVLTPRQKAGLFNLTNYLVKQAGRRYRVMLSIDRVCTALANSVTAGENLLELPELILLELHQYE